MSGPLTGYKVIEIAGIGPGPFCAMLLADMGADVIRVDRAQSVRGPAPAEPPKDVSLRNRRSVAIDLKHPDGVATLLDLVEHADALIEGFRPGVMERLGVGPDECFARNPKLVFGRMTGWGQDGPYAPWAGHDINYISLAGALAHIGRAGEAPVPPLNLVGDFGGGGMFLAFGVVCAILEAQRSGQGQVVDAAMVDGTATLMSMFWGMSQIGVWDGSQRGVNLLDTGAHFYDAYECATAATSRSARSSRSSTPSCCASPGCPTTRSSPSRWTSRSGRRSRTGCAEVFKGKTRDEWCALMEHTDVCFAPVLTMAEAAEHPHNIARQMIVERDGLKQPAPAPRFSRTVPEITRSPQHAGQGTIDALADWGIPKDRIDKLVEDGAVVAS